MALKELGTNLDEATVKLARCQRCQIPSVRRSKTLGQCLYRVTNDDYAPSKILKGGLS